MSVRVLLSLFLLSASGVAYAQDIVDGAVTGVIRFSGSVLPGVQVAVVSGDVKREAITDTSGHFAITGLGPGQYQVSARLPGFVPTTGIVTLTPQIHRVLLEWSMAVGCPSEDIKITVDSRQAAPLVNLIAHVRVQGSAGLVSWSSRPDCEGKVVESYRVNVLNTIQRGRGTEGTTAEFYVEKPYESLEPGGEYLVLLWPGSIVGHHLAFPIINGRVSAANDPLDGRSVADAWTELSRWSRQRP